MRHTAEEVLDKASKELVMVKELLLERDNSATIISLQCRSDEDIRTASLSLSLEDGIVIHLLRILCVRYLTQEYLKGFKKPLSYDKTPAKRRRNGSTEKFIERLGLPLSQTRKALKIGQKFLDIEHHTSISGISLVLMSAWYMFEHLFSDEIARLVKIFLDGVYPELTEAAQLLSDFLFVYQDLYDRHVNKIRETFSQAQQDSS
jgi:hypothetical protein